MLDSSTHPAGPIFVCFNPHFHFLFVFCFSNNFLRYDFFCTSHFQRLPTRCILMNNRTWMEGCLLVHHFLDAFSLVLRSVYRFLKTFLCSHCSQSRYFWRHFVSKFVYSNGMFILLLYYLQWSIMELYDAQYIFCYSLSRVSYLIRFDLVSQYEALSVRPSVRRSVRTLWAAHCSRIWCRVFGHDKLTDDINWQTQHCQQ